MPGKKNPIQIFKELTTGAITIGVIYLAFGLAWITLSDALVQSIFHDADVAIITAVQTYKGYAYIILTAILLVLLIGGFAQRLKTAIEKQQDSGSALRKLVDEVGKVIAQLDLNGKFVYTNTDFCKFFGYTAEEMLRKSIFELTHPDDHEADKVCWARLLARETNDIQKEKRFLNKKNQISWAQEKVTLVEDSKRDPRYIVLVIHDINSLKQAESKLEENIQYYQTVLENSFDGVSIVDKEGVIKYQTPSVASIIGYPKDSRLGSSAFSFIVPDDLPKVQTIMHQLVNGELPEARTVIRYTRADSEIRYLDLYVKNMLADRLINGLVVNFRDITERFIAEHKLIESEEQYKLLFLHNPVPVFIYDLQTLDYLQINDAAVKSYGYTREEFLGMNLRDIRPKEDIQKVIDDVARIESGGIEQNKIWRHLTKSGELKYVEISSITIQYNGKRARMSIANDVTSIINNQENMRQSEERYRHLVENLPAGAVLVQGEELYFNKAVADITGYSRDEVNTLDSWFQKLYTGDAKLIRQYYEQDKAANFGLARTVSLTTKGGAKRWATFFAYKFETGEVWLIQDVTEQKKTDELIINSIIEAEDRERKRIAEELRDGLGNLLVSANFMLEKVMEDLSQLTTEQQEYLNNAVELIRHATTGTRSIAANLIPLNLVEADITDILKDFFAKTQISTRLTLNFKSEVNKPIVNPNLANNLYRIAQEAIHHITKHSNATHVIAKLTNNISSLIFTIEDNGLQTSAAGEEAILTNITNRVKTIGGTMEVKSVADGGTRLTVVVPFSF